MPPSEFAGPAPSWRRADFSFELPPELIAQHPSPARGDSRLLLLDRAKGKVAHSHFQSLPDYLDPGDLLVINDSRVIPARIFAAKAEGGGRVEMLLSEEIAPNDWWALLKPGKRVREGTRLILLDRRGAAAALEAVVVSKNSEGHCRIRFKGGAEILDQLGDLGSLPLPPYIKRPSGHPDALDEARYQTIFSKAPGSVAAPTAGLHFTTELLERLERMKVGIMPVTLHVGLGTFAPVKADWIRDHRMHGERFELSEAVARAVEQTKAAGRRVVAVGTTSVRVLESAWAHCGGLWRASRGTTNLFVYPPFQFHAADALITNFHLPESTLLMLVSAFASPEKIDGLQLLQSAYAEAIRERYRFFSYGDAMLIH